MTPVTRRQVDAVHYATLFSQKMVKHMENGKSFIRLYCDHFIFCEPSIVEFDV
jgi:hypothetical protein